MKRGLSLLVRCRWARRAGTRDFYPALAALVSLVKRFLTVHYLNLYVLIAQQPDQAVVQGRLSLNVCLN
jgi:hypothetical protein